MKGFWFESQLQMKEWKIAVGGKAFGRLRSAAASFSLLRGTESYSLWRLSLNGSVCELSLHLHVWIVCVKTAAFPVMQV